MSARNLDTLAGLIEMELQANMSTGTSGRWILDYGINLEQLADAIALRILPAVDREATS